jgi:choline dehydrogenase
MRPQAVVDRRGLRVVDASIFPRIPGFFIAAPIFMIAEKASDVIIADAASSPSV